MSRNYFQVPDPATLADFSIINEGFVALPICLSPHVCCSYAAQLRHDYFEFVFPFARFNRILFFSSRLDLIQSSLLRLIDRMILFLLEYSKSSSPSARVFESSFFRSIYLSPLEYSNRPRTAQVFESSPFDYLNCSSLRSIIQIVCFPLDTSNLFLLHSIN